MATRSESLSIDAAPPLKAVSTSVNGLSLVRPVVHSLSTVFALLLRSYTVSVGCRRRPRRGSSLTIFPDPPPMSIRKSVGWRVQRCCWERRLTLFPSYLAAYSGDVCGPPDDPPTSCATERMVPTSCAGLHVTLHASSLCDRCASSSRLVAPPVQPPVSRPATRK